MKRKMIMCAIFLLVSCIGVVLGEMLSGKGMPQNALLADNVEALSQGEEVVISCSSSSTGGQCFTQTSNLKFCGTYTYYECRFTGSTYDSCWYPCN